jgi:metal-responsive CopG/Arc/MetJ family transcriptional regulator
MIGNKRISVRIPKNILGDMDKKIKQKGMSRSDLVRFALSDYLYGEGVKE